MSRKAQKAETRKLIQETALACIAEAGYAATSIDSITRAAGVAKGTFYVHFKSKDALLDNCLETFNSNFLVELSAAGIRPDGETAVPSLTALAGAFLDYWQANKAFVSAYAQRAAGGLDSESLHQGVNPRTAGLLAAALQGLALRHGVQLDDAELVVHGILSIWLRLGLRYLFVPNSDRERTIELLTTMTAGALGGAIPELKPLFETQPVASQAA